MAEIREKSYSLGHRWRSSQFFVLATIAIALFAETFLYGYLVPILNFMLMNRLQSDPSHAQELISTVLGVYGVLGVVTGPIIGHLADKSPDRKMPLLISLSLCIVGTCLVAGAHTIHILIFGRVMQGIAGSAVWIIGFATVADNMSPDRVGFGMGLMLSFANSGTISGPVISGLLLEATGYWATWSVPILVLTVDLIARVVMIEPPPKALPSPNIASTGFSPLEISGEEQDGLSEENSFWRIILFDGRVVTCLLITGMSVTVTGSFEATLPLYVQENFGWGSSTVGMLFSGLVIPGLIIGPLAGWVRDRIGARIPAVFGAILQATVLIAMGTLRPFVSGIAPAELTAAAKAHQERTPGIFGTNGGTSRVIAMLDVASSLGLSIGPLLGGVLKALIGFKYMTWAWGKYF
ncbi:hypothetical protein PENANT_c008G00573 [Penicillium antarcticum]|uniref:Major facilitator superfamily (MFS) profile domain-containing protein n=1 Tax=Penicillium antarcticum TaxID=416450 RepID=A0A1V6QAJ8_9EURO|nr:hypothetical protein PENANT_c008G00573 [Penicillium antarcticum]